MRQFNTRASVAALILLTGSAARAQVVQPNGTEIPATTGPISGYLNGSAQNDNIDEGIDVRNDAAVEPQQFAPQCDFGGKYIAKGGGANFAIGWYNVDPSRPDSSPPKYVPLDTGANLNVAAPSSDIQILFPFSSSLPAEGQRELTAASIRQHAAYAGGLIGLVLVPNPNGTGTGNATQYHYTEHRYNVQCTQCSTPGPWYSHLTYRSKQLADTFYLGFEDLDFADAPGAQGVNGNDLDYEDFLFRFTGLTCPGAGVPCTESSGVGACSAGVTDCDAQGQLICVPVLSPGAEAETCDGVDNDCNGTVDDGATCDVGQVCDRGRCVRTCGGEISRCAGGLLCKSGRCVEPDCVDKTCPDGELCVAGACKAPCDGVSCPHGSECRSGRCVDPCDGVTCDTGKVCQSGVCVTGCSCGTCADGFTCVAATERCVETSCVGIDCEEGLHCEAGVCVDDCAGAVCPSGEKCEAGACVPIPPAPDAGTSGGDAGSNGGTDGGSSNGENDGGAADAGTGPGDGLEGPPETGCGCAASGAGPLVITSLLALGLLRRRRPE